MLRRVQKLVPERLFTHLDIILMFFIRFVYPILTSTVSRVRTVALTYEMVILIVMYITYTSI